MQYNIRTIRNILLDDHDYLDLLSVLEGFRDVCLISAFNIQVKSYNLKNGTCKFKPVPRQYIQIKEFISENYPDYSLIRISRVNAALIKNTKIKKLRNLLKKYPSPMNSIEGSMKLGLLLGYPKCCVKNYRNYINKYIPFMACTFDCQKEWSNHYSKLQRKYNIRD